MYTLEAARHEEELMELLNDRWGGSKGRELRTKRIDLKETNALDRVPAAGMRAGSLNTFGGCKVFGKKPSALMR